MEEVDQDVAAAGVAFGQCVARMATSPRALTTYRMLAVALSHEASLYLS